MKHIISALVENKPGVLAHVAGMFAARGFNIDSLVVGRTEDPNLSRMTIVVIGDDRIVEQVRKQLARIIPVVKVQDFVGKPVVARDLMLVTVAVPPEKRPEIVSHGRDVPRPRRRYRPEVPHDRGQRPGRRKSRPSSTSAGPTASRTSPAPAPSPCPARAPAARTDKPHPTTDNHRLHVADCMPSVAAAAGHRTRIAYRSRLSTSYLWVAATRPKAFAMANGRTIGKSALAAATQGLITCHETHAQAVLPCPNEIRVGPQRQAGPCPRSPLTGCPLPTASAHLKVAQVVHFSTPANEKEAFLPMHIMRTVCVRV